MRKNVRIAYATAGLAAAAVLCVPVRARAQATTPSCDDTTQFPNPVFISGSSASQPVLQALAGVLGTSVSIIYQNPDSCFGLNDAISGMASTESGTKTMYLNPTTGAAEACTLTPATDIVDIGVSDVFPSTCQTNLGTGGTTAGQQIEVLGPIQAMTIAVPFASSATSISDKAAYVVFGYDANTFIVPQWNAPANVLVRANTSGTLNMIGTAIGLAAHKWANATPGNLPDGGPPPAQQEGSTGAMFSGIAGVTSNADATIGILSDEAAIQNNAKPTADGGIGPQVKVLPFQYQDQTCGYLPDSSTTSLDKLNVREGRYAIWGPLHFVANVDAQGNLTAAHAAASATVLNYFIATGPNGGTLLPTGPALGDGGIATTQIQSIVDAESNPLVGGVVPWCAMEVMRTAEIGPEASYQPDEPCGCHFEFVATGATISPYCTSCSTDADCNPDGGTSAYPVCRYNYCEAK